MKYNFVGEAAQFASLDDAIQAKFAGLHWDQVPFSAWLEERDAKGAFQRNVFVAITRPAEDDPLPHHLKWEEMSEEQYGNICFPARFPSVGTYLESRFGKLGAAELPHQVDVIRFEGSHPKERLTLRLARNGERMEWSELNREEIS